MAAMVGGFLESKDIAFISQMETQELKDTLSCEPAHLLPQADPAKDPKEQEEEVKDPIVKPESNLGPQLSLKERDQADESFKKCNTTTTTPETVNTSTAGGTVKQELLNAESKKEAEVKVVSLSIESPGRTDNVMPIPFVPNSKGTLFTLKEGSRSRFKFRFAVSNDVVAGFTYTNTVWKSGIRVDNRKVILGTYSPKQEPYSFAFEEETIPTGIFARGSYSARTKFVDDDGKCYLDVKYRFEIQKKW